MPIGNRLDPELVILESCETSEERAWYIEAVQRFNWSKAELLEKIASKAHLEISLDLSS